MNAPRQSQPLLRISTEEDGDAIARVHTSAFDRDDEARLVSALLREDELARRLSIVGEIDGVVVAHILFSLAHINGHPAAALAPVAVTPEWQRRGIGSALVRRGLELCRDSGPTLVVVLGHSDYYPRFGFVRASRFGIRAPFEVPDEAFMVCELVEGAASGVFGVVEYHPAFGEL